jgi:hypothetical protein
MKRDMLLGGEGYLERFWGVIVAARKTGRWLEYPGLTLRTVPGVVFVAT